MRVRNRFFRNSDNAGIAWGSAYQIKGGNIFKVTKHDIYSAIAGLITTIFVWFSFHYFSEFNHIFSYWDSSEAFFSYKMRAYSSIRDPYHVNNSKIVYSDVLNPLPVQRTVFRLFYIVSFGYPHLAQIAYTLFFSMLSVVVFRRFLEAYDIVKDPMMTTIYFCIFPVRFLFYRSLPTYDTLFFTLILLSFYFFRIGYNFPLLITAMLASFTRFEGVILFLTFTPCYFIARDIKNAFIFGVTFFLFAFLIINKYPNFMNYMIPFPKEDTENFNFVLFNHFIEIRDKIRNIRAIHSLHSILFPSFLGAFLLLFQSLPLSFFCFIYSLFLSCFNSLDLHRFSIPVFTLSILVGVDFLISNPSFAPVLKFLVPFIFIAELYYCGYSINGRPIPNNIYKTFFY